jgi:hypothetical protein
MPKQHACPARGCLHLPGLQTICAQKEVSEDLRYAQQQLRDMKVEKQALGDSLDGSEAALTRLKEEREGLSHVSATSYV